MSENKKTLYMMQGFPASGKSFIAGLIYDYCSEIEGKGPDSLSIRSTDLLWYDEDGVYRAFYKRNEHPCSS